jgi:hypothetical protein
LWLIAANITFLLWGLTTWPLSGSAASVCEKVLFCFPLSFHSSSSCTYIYTHLKCSQTWCLLQSYTIFLYIKGI